MPENIVKEVPSFLQNPELTKPDSDARHHEKLIEIASGFDKDDAEIVCWIFAKKYPGIMLQAIADEMSDLRILRDDVVKATNKYGAQED